MQPDRDLDQDAGDHDEEVDVGGDRVLGQDDNVDDHKVDDDGNCVPCEDSGSCVDYFLIIA